MICSLVALRISPTRNANSIPTRISGSSNSELAGSISTLTSVSVSSTRYSSAPIRGLYCASRFNHTAAFRLQHAAKTGGENSSIPSDAARRTDVRSSGDTASTACIKRKYSSTVRLGVCRESRSYGSAAFFSTSSTENPIADRYAPWFSNTAQFFIVIQKLDAIDKGQTKVLIPKTMQ